MYDTTTRRGFIAVLTGGVALALAPPVVRAGEYEAKSELHPEFPTQDPAIVREVVGASHGRIERVQELVTASPALAKAAWDWGFGDWESALGAASHMGRRDIAELLMSHGARPDLFTFAMMGDVAAVKACVAAMPGIQKTPGPHGITLLQHARIAGEPAAAVTAYLESLGDADLRATNLETSDEQKAVYVGHYRFGPDPDDTFEVSTNRRGMVAIQRGERFSRALNRVEEHGFAPSGATDVRVRFTVTGERAMAVTVHDPHPLVTATRTE